ncbi:MAG TPA: hypothetical protein PLC03_13995 [Microthrixaceae bacterium]|nr:hypothetical protein [Microthrixaceae bacterium]
MSDVGAETGPIPGARWRSAVAVLLVALTMLGATALTDDSWPFAPFRMFAHPVRSTGRVAKVDFTALTASGRELRLDAEAFGLRRAEVEGQKDSSGRLTEAQMAGLAAAWNRAHPSDPLVELRFRKFGRNLIDGHPVSDFSRVVQTWTARSGS